MDSTDFKKIQQESLKYNIVTDKLNRQIPIYIPSFNRAETIKTSVYLDTCNIPYKVLLHSEECKKAYLAAGRVKEENIIVTGAPFGITNQRNWMVDNLAKQGEWYISLDDNISHFKRFDDFIYNSQDNVIDVDNPKITQKNYNHFVDAEEFIRIIAADILIAEARGAEYVGYATVDNYYFNSKRYKDVGYVISKAVAIKYDGLRYDEKLEAMEDFGYCAEQLIKNDRVLINGWMMPVAGHYEKGGIGTYEQRVPRKIIDCKYLMKKYPNFFRYKVKKDCHPEAEVQIRFNNIKQIQEWKKEQLNKSQSLTLF